MGSLRLITGGAKSGKSKFAEQLCPQDQPVCYVATGVMTSPDAEMQLRIQRHQQRRPAIWVTKEGYRHVATFIQEQHYQTYLLDDVTMLTTNLFFAILQDSAPTTTDFDQVLARLSKVELAKIRQKILDEWQAILHAIRQGDSQMTMVTNEVGLGLVPATKQARVLRDLYGEVNQVIATEADEVYFVISGLPQQIK